MAENTEEYVDLEVAEKKQVFNCKCPSCGAELEYSPSDIKLVCPFCGASKEIDLSRKVSEQDFDNLFKAQNTWGDQTHVVVCKNCGVKEVVLKSEIGKSCSYCGTPNVVKTDELSGLKPNGVVPFQITKEEASEFVKKWAKKKFYAARAFKKNVNPEEIAGTYNPAFTFDASSYSSYSGRLGKHYYETRTINGKTQRVRKTRYFDISGTYSRFFDDVLVKATTNKNMNVNVGDFDTNNAQDYSEEFILGFSASQYDRDGKECWNIAKGDMASMIRRGILDKYDYDVVDKLNVNTDYSDMTYKYLLLPIYVGHCSYRKKIYNFFVNGKTGAVAGKVPLSILKVGITVLIIAALVLGIIILAALD